MHMLTTQTNWDQCGQPTGGLIVVNADSVQLQVAVSVVCASWVDSMLIADHFPELQAETNFSLLSSFNRSVIMQLLPLLGLMHSLNRNIY